MHRWISRKGNMEYVLEILRPQIDSWFHGAKFHGYKYTTEEEYVIANYNIYARSIYHPATIDVLVSLDVDASSDYTINDGKTLQSIQTIRGFVIIDLKPRLYSISDIAHQINKYHKFLSLQPDVDVNRKRNMIKVILTLDDPSEEDKAWFKNQGTYVIHVNLTDNCGSLTHKSA